MSTDLSVVLSPTHCVRKLSFSSPVALEFLPTCPSFTTWCDLDVFFLNCLLINICIWRHSQTKWMAIQTQTASFDLDSTENRTPVVGSGAFRPVNRRCNNSLFCPVHVCSWWKVVSSLMTLGLCWRRSGPVPYPTSWKSVFTWQGRPLRIVVIYHQR